VSVINTIVLAFVIARRDLRGGMGGRARSLSLLILGVFIGVAAVAFIATASQSLRDGAQKGALEAVGGDLSLRLFHRFPSPAELDLISQQGAVSVSAELRPMAQAKGRFVLVEMKGVDDAYPLYGEVGIASQRRLKDVLRGGGAVVDALLLERLGVAIGDSVQIGETTFEIRDTLSFEPDRAFRAFALGPRIMVNLDALPATGLVQPGAEVYIYTHVKLGADENADAALKRIVSAFPDAGWRLVNARDGVPGVERTLSMVQVLLLFIGLGVMLVGGAGISGAVRAHISTKLSVIAILKSIGTPPGVITLAMGLEVLLGALAGAVAGMFVGAFGPMVVVQALGNDVPFALSPWPDVGVLLGAGLFGILVAMLFAWWPLMALRGVTTRALLRERFDHVPGRWSVSSLLGGGILVTGIAILIFALSPMPVLSGAFLVGGLMLAGVYLALGRVFGVLAKKLAKVLGERHVLARLALGNLHRAGAPTGAVVMALGLTLTLLVALDGIEAAAVRHVSATLPRQAPDLVMFSIPADRAQELRRASATWDSVQNQRILPFLHARVQAIKGVPVTELKIPGSLNWVVRGDRGVSFAEAVPPQTEIVRGTWWTAQTASQSLLSVDAGFAEKIGLKLGDAMTLNVSGAVVRGRIANLRRIDWTGLDLDFPIIASPGAMAGVPHTFAASLKAKPGHAGQLEAQVRERVSDLPLIRVSEVIDALSTALQAVLSGLRLAALMTGAAALVVLAGSVLQGLRERTDEALLFKVLGARRGQLLRLLAVEFVGLGVLVALVAMPLGLAVAGGVAYAAKLADVQIAWTGGLGLAGLAIVVSVIVGLAATWGAYTAAPARYLRRRDV